MKKWRWWRKKSEQQPGQLAYVTENGRMVTPADLYMALPEIQEELQKIRESKFYEALIRRKS